MEFGDEKVRGLMHRIVKSKVSFNRVNVDCEFDPQTQLWCTRFCPIKYCLIKFIL